MLNVLNDILLSDNVVENFYRNYNNEEFKEWLLNILPEVEDCKNLNQDNPWHIYNCLDHILHSVEEMNKQTVNLNQDTRKILAYTMFLHDIGKPQCHIRRYSKLYKREVDSFFNHNKASVEIANRVLKDFGFNEKQLEEVKALVEDHDIFMFITLQNDNNQHHKVLSPKVIREEVDRLNQVGNGQQLMQYLIMVGKSDNRAQNPELTPQSLKMLDVMEEMLLNENDIENE